jgi:hypothetical protein
MRQRCSDLGNIKGKGKGTIYAITDHEGPEVD